MNPVMAFAISILHGDEEHRVWLLEQAVEFITKEEEKGDLEAHLAFLLNNRVWVEKHGDGWIWCNSRGTSNTFDTSQAALQAAIEKTKESKV